MKVTSQQSELKEGILQINCLVPAAESGGMLALICKIIGVCSSWVDGLSRTNCIHSRTVTPFPLAGLPCTEQQRTISPYSEVWKRVFFFPHGEFCSVNSLYQTIAQTQSGHLSLSLSFFSCCGPLMLPSSHTSTQPKSKTALIVINWTTDTVGLALFQHCVP